MSATSAKRPCVHSPRLSYSARTINALSKANIRTLGGLARKKEDDLLEVEGLGMKAIQEVKRALSNYGITLK